jgi:hypothetical protein
MALTASDAVTRAMQKLRVIGPGKEPKAAEAEFGLNELNDMLAEWSIDGIDLAAITLDSTDADRRSRRSQCGDHPVSRGGIGSVYGAQLSPIDAASLPRRLDILRAYHFSIATLKNDNPNTTSRYG